MLRRLLRNLTGLVLALIAGPALAALPVQGFDIKAIYPHDPNAYTQGLFYHQGFLFESTGQVGRSNIRKVRLTALVDGEAKLSAVVALNSKEKTAPVVLEWTVCGRNGNCSP